MRVLNSTWEIPDNHFSSAEAFHLFPWLRKLARVSLGAALGISFGVLVGYAMNNIAIGIAIGLIFGTGTGAAWELKRNPKDKSES